MKKRKQTLPPPGDKFKLENNKGYSLKFTGLLTYENEITKISEANNDAYPVLSVGDSKVQEEEFKRSEIDTRLFQLGAAAGLGFGFQWIKSFGTNAILTTAAGWSIENIEVQTRKVVYSYDEIKIYARQKINWFTKKLLAQQFYGSEVVTPNKYQISYLEWRWIDTKHNITVATLREMNPLNKSVKLPTKICRCDFGKF